MTAPWAGSVRARVFAALAATVALSTVLTVVVASVILGHQARVRRERTVDRVADAVVGTLGPAGGAPGVGLGAARARVRVVRLASLAGGRGRQVRGAGRRAILAAVPARDGTSGTATVQGRSVAYAVRDTPDGRIVLVANTGAGAAAGPPPGRTVVLAGLGGLVLALVLGGALTRRLTAPVRAVTRAAGDLAAGNEAVRVPEDGPTELARLGGAFNAMAADLQAARASERDFLLSVSHELKTPLTAVAGYAEAIGDGTVAPAQGAAIVGEEAARLGRLVDDLLDLARARQAGFAVARDPIDLAAVAHDAVRRHAPQARRLGVVLEADGPDGGGAGGAPGIGDAGRALQAVSNLVENALGVLAAGARVQVVARAGRIEVVDDGPGIPADQLPHAFERFYLHDRRPDGAGGGSGLGLALVAALAQAMGGSVSAAPAAPRGTRFTLVLDGGVGAGGAASAEDA